MVLNHYAQNPRNRIYEGNGLSMTVNRSFLVYRLCRQNVRFTPVEDNPALQYDDGETKRKWYGMICSFASSRSFSDCGDRCCSCLLAAAVRTINDLEWTSAPCSAERLGTRDVFQSDANYGRGSALRHSTCGRAGSVHGGIFNERPASASLLVPLVRESRYLSERVLSGLLVPYIVLSTLSSGCPSNRNRFQR